ncbi:hypothetical protein [Sphingomonas alba]|uniref:Uncharacterized protein n=1 Tax=Sphingomonas alba TaxID=2908208 RepID=A0ABT0RMT2_9SPHN|nr:hypothetical protein [Sphingomonas alba]MCL6683964.1 hypothetical protein [Sphingomonas alba]
MKVYDLYLFATEKAVVLGWHSYEADGDQAAIQIANELVKQPPAELWQESNLIKHWDCRT